MRYTWLMNPLTHSLAPAPEPVAFDASRRIALYTRESWQNCIGRIRSDMELRRSAVLSLSWWEDGNTVRTRYSIPCGDTWDSERSGLRKSSKLQHRIGVHTYGNEREESLRYCGASLRSRVSSKNANVSTRIADRKQTPS